MRVFTIGLIAVAGSMFMTDRADAARSVAVCTIPAEDITSGLVRRMQRQDNFNSLVEFMLLNCPRLGALVTDAATASTNRPGRNSDEVEDAGPEPAVEEEEPDDCDCGGYDDYYDDYEDYGDYCAKAV